MSSTSGGGGGGGDHHGEHEVHVVWHDITLADVADRPLGLLLRDHHEKQLDFRLRLRETLHRQRTDREACRRNQHLGELAARRTAFLTNDSVNRLPRIATGKADESIWGWKGIEHHGDTDKRLRYYRETDQCEVLDVMKTLRAKQQLLLAPPQPLSEGGGCARLPSIGGSSPSGPGLTARASVTTARKQAPSNATPRPPPPGAIATSRSPRGGVLQPTASSISAAAGSSMSRKRRSPVNVSARSRGSRRDHAAGASANAPGVGGASVGASRTFRIRGTHNKVVEYAAPPKPLLRQMESDFLMLSYGASHAKLDTFRDYGREHMADLGDRRVCFAEIIDYMTAQSLEDLPLQLFIHIVYPQFAIPGIVRSIRRHAKHLGWACDLSWPIADAVHRLWTMAKRVVIEGEEHITFPEFSAIVLDTFTIDQSELKQMFLATDEDGNGNLSKDEFASFISGRVDVLAGPGGGDQLESSSSSSSSSFADGSDPAAEGAAEGHRHRGDDVTVSLAGPRRGELSRVLLQVDAAEVSTQSSDGAAPLAANRVSMVLHGSRHAGGHPPRRSSIVKRPHPPPQSPRKQRLH